MMRILFLVLCLLPFLQAEGGKDFHLRSSTAKSCFYVGEPILVTMKWYLCRDAKNFDWDLPLFQLESFHHYNPEGKSGSGFLAIGNERVAVEKSVENFQGKPYTVLSWRRILVPQRAQEIEIPGGKLTLDALVGKQKSKDFLGFLGKEENVYQKTVIAGNPLYLSILEVPSLDKPAHFLGHVGPYQITTEAKPTVVHVKEPITLTIVLAAPVYAGNAELPPWQELASSLPQNFKIPAEKPQVEILGAKKIFTQTLRPYHDQVKEIPALALAYLDPETSAYKMAYSQAIPIQVLPTKIITASDAQGQDLDVRPQADMDNNKEGGGLWEELKNLRFSKPIYALLLILLLCLYGLHLFYIRRKRPQPLDDLSQKAKTAYDVFLSQTQAMQTLSGQQLYACLAKAMKEYLSSHWKINERLQTYADVEKIAYEREVDPPFQERLRQWFTECEKGVYAGPHASPQENDLFTQAMTLVEDMERGRS